MIATQNHTTPLWWDFNKKESVELISVYLLEGCGKTRTKINDAIPHT